MVTESVKIEEDITEFKDEKSDEPEDCMYYDICGSKAIYGCDTCAECGLIW